ncbi:hypothetical protein MSG28_010979, partial [Choristoneura fumiferana]
MAAVSAFMAGDANKNSRLHEESIVTLLKYMQVYAARVALSTDPRWHAYARCALAGRAARGAACAGRTARRWRRWRGARPRRARTVRAWRWRAALQPRTSRTPSCASTCWRTRYCVLCVGRLTRDAVRWLARALAPAARALQPAHQQDAFLREYMLAHQVLCAVCGAADARRGALAGRAAGAGRACAAARAPAGRLPARVHAGAPVHSYQLPLSLQNVSLAQTKQTICLKVNFIHRQQWVESSEEFKEHLPVLPLPLLESEATAVLCVGPAPLSSPGREPASSLSFADAATRHEERVWHKLEEMLLQVAQGSVPMIFKPTVDLYTSKTDRNPVVPQGEPIQISITLRNPLKIVTILKDVELLWQFVANSDDLESTKQILNNELMVASGSSLESSAICGQKIKSVILEGESSKSLIFSITPLQIGQLCVQGVAYKPRGHGPVYFAAEHPDCVHLLAPDPAAAHAEPFRELYEEKYKEPTVYTDERAARAGAWRAAAARRVRVVCGGVARGACARVRLVMRARAAAPALALLAYYEPARPPSAPARTHRLLRHVFRFTPTVRSV